MSVPAFPSALLALAVLWVAPGPASPTALPDLEERWVEAGGARYRALCTSGDVEVVLLHDEDGRAEDWLGVLQALDGRVGACAWDRTPDGREPSRGWFELLDELALVHGALADPAPVVVGHGAGGLYARLLAADRPSAVAGLVLVEPWTEGALERMRRGMPEEVWAARQAARARPNADGVRVASLLRRVERRRLPDRPVTVVTATERPRGDGWEPRWIDEAARRHQGAVVAGVRRGRHVPAPGSGYAVPTEAPDLVAEEILRLVGGRAR